MHHILYFIIWIAVSNLYFKSATAVNLKTKMATSQNPLLDDIIDGSVDYKGHPVRRSNAGGWRCAAFLIGKPNQPTIIIHPQHIYSFICTFTYAYNYTYTYVIHACTIKLCD